MNNEWGFTGYLYAPPLSEAGSALRSYAAGCSRMGAVFIEYGGCLLYTSTRSSVWMQLPPC